MRMQTETHALYIIMYVLATYAYGCTGFKSYKHIKT